MSTFLVSDGHVLTQKIFVLHNNFVGGRMVSSSVTYIRAKLTTQKVVVILLPKVIYGLKAVAFRSLFYVLYKSVSGTAGQVILEEILAETHF